MGTVKINCKCGKLVGEMDWSNKTQSKMVFDKFGSLDDYYFFPCQCGEINPMHYTGYDNLVEGLEYEAQMNNDIKCLNKNGSWVYDSVLRDVEVVNSRINGFAKIHSIDDGYEEHFFYRQGAKFMKVSFNPVHETYEIFNYEAKPEAMNELISYFFK